MSNWVVFFVGLVVFVASSALLSTAVLGTLVAGMKRFLLGRIVGGAIKGTKLDQDLTHRSLGVLGLETRNGGPSDAELEQLRPRRWQETLAWVCYAGIALGFGLMIYAMIL
ncbi:hypothetical protein [Devosia sp. A16]|uniref:hypothetical protein n=1 Tax=Devosia sp. A16 TaxID=1736675 RepID=UPI0006D76285|nr:hypothetical protein [Devosia sp. A16]